MRAAGSVDVGAPLPAPRPHPNPLPAGEGARPRPIPPFSISPAGHAKGLRGEKREGDHPAPSVRDGYDDVADVPLGQERFLGPHELSQRVDGGKHGAYLATRGTPCR